MLQSLPWAIGLRYIRSKRRNGFIAFVSLFALLGMMLGVFALIVVLSVMNGFDHELKARILKVVPHGYISRNDGLDNWQATAANIESTPHLLGSAPFVEGKGLISYGGVVRGVELQGIDPATESKISDIDESMLVGSLDMLAARPYGLVLGSMLARHLGVSIGDKVSITLPIMSMTPAGVFPRSKRFTVIGVFEVGAQVDQTLALMHLADAQKLFRLGDQVHGLRLRFDDIYRAPEAVQQLLRDLPSGFVGKDWSQTQGGLWQAVKMEKLVVGVMLSVIVAVAAFNIVTSLIMMVAEKRSDIAVLRTLGLSKPGIVKIFMIQGTVMGMLGIAIGAGLGIAVAHFLPQIIASLEQLFGFQVFDQNVYYVAHFPSVWRLEDTLWTCLLAVTVSLLATIYPAYRAAQIAPAEVLRYDM